MIEAMSEEREHTKTADVVALLDDRVKVEAVDARPEDGLTFVTIRLPDGITEQARLATQEWVDVQLRAMSDGVVFVPRYL